MTGRPNPFWEYSVLLFGDAGVAAACVAIQDRHGAVADVDINALLLCTWAAATGVGELDNQTLRNCVAAVGPWRRDVVLPLRACRRAIAGGIEPVPGHLATSVRAEVGRAEIEAERIEQMMLVELVGRQPSKAVTADVATRDAATSFARFFAVLGVESTLDDDRDLARILAVAFPSHGPSRRPRREPGGGSDGEAVG